MGIHKQFSKPSRRKHQDKQVRETETKHNKQVTDMEQASHRKQTAQKLFHESQIAVCSVLRRRT